LRRFPVPLEGDDVGEIIDRHRDQLPMNEHMVTMDAPMHTQERALIMRLLTPKRLKENEEFMWRLADRQIDEFVAAAAASSSAPTHSPSPCSSSPTCSGCPKPTTSGSESSSG
jgi:cytochrome P450